MKNINIYLLVILIIFIIFLIKNNRENFVEMRDLILKNGQVTDGRWNKYIDKILFKKYAKSKGIKTIPTIAIFNNSNEIKIDDIPHTCAIKSNKASGRNIFIKNNIILNGKLKNKNIRDINVFKIINNWGNIWDHYDREKQYESIVPKIFIEPLIDPFPSDYKFQIFHGQISHILYMNERYVKKFKCVSVKNPDWSDTHCEFASIHSEKCDIIPKPKNLEKMKKQALLLAGDLDHVRIDMYEINGEIYAGEMTFTQDAGFHNILKPHDCQQKMLDLWMQK